MDTPTDPNEISREAWDANAEHWDARMGDEGNDFFNLLCWPVLASFLDAPLTSSRGSAPSTERLKDQHILDIACGNGLTSRRLAALGAQVTAFDFSANLVEKARVRSAKYGEASQIAYHVLDATDEQALLSLGERSFDAAICNMALFDMPEIEPLFQALRKLLKPNGVFAFSLMHPAFNNSSVTLFAEEWDNGQIQTRYGVKVTRYINQFLSEGLALRNQPKPQLYFHRPLKNYMNVAFQNGFVLDGFDERAFPPNHPQTVPLGWGGKFSEIPPALIMRFRLK
jgi:2-polyprenyl-3-methyl-5-hydroxy-6-metoxy-1,4-benzoquinol methylase